MHVVQSEERAMKQTKELHLENCTIGKNVSEKYSPISGELYLKPFLDRGWEKTRGIFNNKGTKEWITLEHPNYKFLDTNDTIRIELLNSYDGSSALMIMGGIGRIACSNGLVVGKDFESFRFIHRGESVYKKLEQSYIPIMEKLDALKNKIEKLKAMTLNTKQVNELIINIYKEAVGKDTKTKKVTLLNIRNHILTQTQKPRRVEDSGLDAFTTMNVIQERMIRLGLFECSVNITDKELDRTQVVDISKNACEGKLSSIKLNEIITDKFLALVA
jgi:hypothetical protein